MALSKDSKTVQIDFKAKIDDLLKGLKDANVDVSKIESGLIDVKDGLKNVEKASDEAGKKGSKSFLEWFAKISIVEKGLALVRRAIDFTKEFKNAQRDANETQNKFDVVFESIKNKANKTAQEISRGFGLAESTTKKYLSSVGDILVGLGYSDEAALDFSKRVVTLSQDLASFTNIEGGAANATDALSKLLIGETESAKRLGIVIRQDQPEFINRVKTYKELNKVTETQARAAILLQMAEEQSAKARGDFARTSDQLANKERVLEERYKALQERIGTGLIPFFEKLTSVQLSLVNMALGDELDQISAAAEKEIVAFEELAYKVEYLARQQNRSVIEQQEYEKALNAIKQAYPEYLSSLDAEKSSHENIVKALEQQRELTKDQIVSNMYMEQRAELARRQAIAERDLILVKMEGEKIAKAYNETIFDETLAAKQSYNTQKQLELKREIKKLGEDLIKIDTERNSVLEKMNTNHKSAIDWTNSLNEARKLLKTKTKELDQSTVDFVNTLLKEDVTVDSIKKQVQDLNKAYQETKIGIDEYTTKIKELQDQYNLLQKQIANQEAMQKSLDEANRIEIDDLIELDYRIKEVQNAYSDLEVTAADTSVTTAEYWDNQLSKVQDFYAKYKDTFDQALKTGSMYNQLMITDIEARYDKELQALNDARANGLYTEDEYQKELLKIQSKAEKDKEKIHKQQKIIDKAMATANTAVAVTNALRTEPFLPLGPIMAALAAAQGAIQVAIIEKQKYALGGLADGPSHSDGGIPAVVLGSSGVRPVEIEGKEIIQTKGVYYDPTTRDLANFTNTKKGGREIPNSRKIKSVAMYYADGEVRNVTGKSGRSVPLSSMFELGGLADGSSPSMSFASGKGISIADLDYIASRLSINVIGGFDVDMKKLTNKISVIQGQMKREGYDLEKLS